MKKFFQYLFLTFVLSFWGIVLTNQDQAREAVKMVKQSVIRPCSRPLEYTIGKIDPQFGISENDFKKLIFEAEEAWEKSSEKNLFEYNPEASFKVNLIFDERQKSFQEAKNMESDLQEMEKYYNNLSMQYDSLSVAYRKKVDAYKKESAVYEKRLEEYEEEIEKWNSKGGAPEDVYEDLEEEKSDLRDAYEKLEKQRKEINELAKKSNNLIEKENEAAQNYNENLTTYKSMFGGTQEFEKGLFSGIEINIYQFQERADLKLTLTHELGHYLGIGHTENSKSIMYYLIGDQDLKNQTLTNEDVRALKDVCRL